LYNNLIVVIHVIQSRFHNSTSHYTQQLEKNFYMPTAA